MITSVIEFLPYFLFFFSYFFLLTYVFFFLNYYVWILLLTMYSCLLYVFLLLSCVLFSFLHHTILFLLCNVFYSIRVFLRLRYVDFYLILRFFLHNIRFFLTSYDNSCYLHTISFTIYMTLSSLRTIFLVISLRYFLRSFPIVS